MEGASTVMTYPPPESPQWHARHTTAEHGSARRPEPLWEPPAFPPRSAEFGAPSGASPAPDWGQPATGGPGDTAMPPRAAAEGRKHAADRGEPMHAYAYVTDHNQPTDVYAYRADHGGSADTYGYPPTRRRTGWDDALPDLRNQIVSRLVSMNWNQTATSWARRRRDPLGPHVLVFFFAEPPSGWPASCELRVTARLFPAGDESRLPMLLYELGPLFNEHFKEGRDPDKVIFSWGERRSHAARYAGVGVTSLDTPDASWDQVQKTAQSDMEVPGRCYAHLVDGSMLLVDRLARQQFAQTRIWSSRTVRDASGRRQHAVTTAHDIASDEYGPDNRQVWHWLTSLNAVLAEGLHHGQ